MKLRLTIQSGSLTNRNFELETGSLLLGRGTDCSLRFDPTGDPSVSTKHAVITAEQDGFYITDQNSTNGTFIDGNRTQRALLQAGNIVQLGYQGPRIQIAIEGLTNLQSTPTWMPTVVENKPTVVENLPRNLSASVPNVNLNNPNQSFPASASFNPNPANQNMFNPGLNNSAPLSNFPNQMPGQGFNPINNPINSAPLPYNQNIGVTAGSQLSRGTNALRESFSNIGIYNPEKEKGNNKILSVVVVTVIGLVLAAITGLILLSSVGFVGAIVGTVLAFTPAPFYLLLFLWLDRYDPEPAWALGGAFAWGALVAVIVSFFVNTIFSSVAMTIVGGPTGDALGAVISAPIIEEATKGLGVLLVFLFLRKEFDDIVDGIVYAGVIALGFATVENVLYYGRQFAEYGVGPQLIVILFLRGVLAPFSHALFTSMTGIGCGIARETHNKALKYSMPVVGYILAVFLHALWNGVAVFVGGIGGGGAYLLFYLVVWVPLFLIMFGVMIYMVHREAKLIKEMLVIEVARGLISSEQLEIVGSSIARIKWLASSVMSRNWKKFSAQRRFLRSVTKLAFCYWHVARASQANSQTQSLPQIPKFQAEVMQLKAEI